jgi:hypothetical protein
VVGDFGWQASCFEPVLVVMQLEEVKLRTDTGASGPPNCFTFIIGTVARSHFAEFMENFQPSSRPPKLAKLK